MTENKAILLIGRSGRGKSTLANVVTNTNNFKESSGSASETKKVQSETFGDCLIIDTPGIGDTKMSDNDVLNIIAEAVYLARNGVGQVFFVTDGRFDQYEMATYDLLRTIIFDENITKHTTIVRTRFPGFRNLAKCQEDISKMTKEFQELEKDLEKKLASTNLSEIIKSCQERVVYVDNPSLEVDDEEELEFNKEDRDKSREILLEHLNKVSKEETYKPEKLKELSDDIAEDYFQYLKKKEELQKELEKEMKRLNSSQTSATSQSSSSQPSSINIPSSQADLTAKEEPTEIQESLMIIEREKRDKIIAELQDKKNRLKKEIAEKEKIIHQKVLKHIFNNYEAINKELGGDIFLNSVTGEHLWSEIHSEFANKGLVVKWLSQGFDYFQTQKWATALNDFNPQLDADFCTWLRDEKKLTVEEIKRQSYPQNIKRWRWEYAIYLGKEVEMLDKFGEQLEKRDWKEIHEDFAKKYKNETYQQAWEKNDLTYQDAQQWIQAGFKPNDYYQVRKWKNHNFTPREVKSWLEIGLDKNDAEFANYLRLKNVQPDPDLNLEQLRKEFNVWVKNPPAQEYLDIYYPKTQRKEITELNIDSKNLQGSLDLSDFVNLKYLDYSENNLTSLNLSNCSKLKEIRCYKNQLTSLDLSDCSDLVELHGNNKLINLILPNNSSNLKALSLNNNNFHQDLSFLQGAVNLERLILANNEFYGSLEYLKEMKNLNYLDIGDTDIDGGLEYLPESVKDFHCLADHQRKDAKCQTIYNLFANEQGEVEIGAFGRIKNFSQKLQAYKQKLQTQQPQILQPNLPKK